MSQPYLHPVQDQSPRFEAGSEITDNGTAPPSGGGESDKTTRATKKARAEKSLPTDRLRFDNQVAVLRYVAQVSGSARKGSTAEDMSAAIDLKGGTGGLNSKFFRDAGWFESVGRGEYTASAGAIAWYQHIGIDPDAQYDAAAQMRDEVKRSWFWEAVEPLLASGLPVTERVVLLTLAKAAGANNHTVQLTMIIEWLAWVGLVIREGDQVKLRELAPAGPGAEDLGAEDVDDEAEVDAQAAREPNEDNGAHVTRQPAAAAQSAAASDPGALVSFNLSVRLTADDMQTLDQDQRDFILALAERLRG